MFAYENDYIGARDAFTGPSGKNRPTVGLSGREARVKIDSRPSSVTQTMGAGKGY